MGEASRSPGEGSCLQWEVKRVELAAVADDSSLAAPEPEPEEEKEETCS